MRRLFASMSGNACRFFFRRPEIWLSCDALRHNARHAMPRRENGAETEKCGYTGK